MSFISSISCKKLRHFSLGLQKFFLQESYSYQQLIWKKIEPFTMSEVTFHGKLDIHKGICIESKDNLCTDITDFATRLEASLTKWKEGGLRGIWFNVAVPQVGWIPYLSEKGFKIHHAKDDVISLYLWLPEKENCKIPHYAHNMVGAGAVVINDENKVLVVRERYRSVPFWKLPGGYVNPGEDIGEAAMREVMEETSVQTEFISLVSLRQIPKSAFGCSDMYFVVHLRPLSSELTKQDEEIEDCKWMDVDEYLSHPEVHATNRMFVRQAILNRTQGIVMKRESSFHPVTNVPQYLFSISHPENTTS